MNDGECRWMADNEICCNSECPMCADYCPVMYTEGVCRFEDRLHENTKEET